MIRYFALGLGAALLAGCQQQPSSADKALEARATSVKALEQRQRDEIVQLRARADKPTPAPVVIAPPQMRYELMGSIRGAVQRLYPSKARCETARRILLDGLAEAKFTVRSSTYTCVPL